MAYLTLKGELAKKNISNETLSKLLKLHRNTVSKKINGSSSFTIEEALAIQSAYFPEMDIRELFKKTKN